MASNSEIEEQLKIALAALEFYANPENYEQGESFGELSRIIDSDLEHKPANRGFDIVGGKLARRALFEIADKEFRLRSKKIKKVNLWNKTDAESKPYFSAYVEFHDSSKEWIKLFPAERAGDDQAPQFATVETVD